MNTKKIALMLGVAAGFSLAGVDAHAQGYVPSVTKVVASDPTDIARVANGRLRKTRYEESNEMATVQMFGGANANKGLYCQMQSASINGVAPTHRQQVACTPLTLTAAADGTVSMVADTTKAHFVTSNVGQDYRNANHQYMLPVNGGKNMLLTYNYRPQGANNTNRYGVVLDGDGNVIPTANAAGQVQKQVVVMQKTNDDCDMRQSSNAGEVVTDVNGSAHILVWAGCNGNGQDDGWLNDYTVKVTGGDANGVGATAQIIKNFDVSLAQREERSRGFCSTATADPNTAICTWTEGNNQPQRDGTWIAAVDISAGGQQGANAQKRVLWKNLIDDKNLISGVQTYSVRANSVRIMSADANGVLTKTDQLIVSTADLRGNNTNNRKGGRYLGIKMGVAQATKDGLTWTVPLQDVTKQMLGIDATHLIFSGGLLQDGAKTLPVITALQGSQNGGGGPSPDLKIMAVDFTAKKFIDYGTHSAGGSYDRHLYSNYLGGNPGNQGRNFAGSQFLSVQTPAGTRFVMAHALTGKDPADAMKPEIKQSGYVSLMTLLQPQAAPPPPPAGEPNMATPAATNGSGGGQNAAPQPGDPDMPATSGTPGGFSGGCSVASTGSSNVGGLFFLLVGVGLLALSRRRRA
jgi:MYXO-CTERM domain-containing protein